MTNLLSNIASLPQDLRTWFARSQSVNVLLTGKTGAGKSTLINSVVGDEVAKVGHGLDAQTLIVSPFKTTRNDVAFGPEFWTHSVVVVNHCQ